MAGSWTEAGSTGYYGDWSPSNVLEAFGGRRSEMLAAWAGVDRSAPKYYKSKEYRSAQRQFERMAKGTTPKPATQEKLNRVGRAQYRKENPLPRVKIHGRIKINDSDPFRKARNINKDITWRNLDQIAQASREGRTQEEREKNAWTAFSAWYIESDEPVGMDMEPGGSISIA